MTNTTANMRAFPVIAAVALAACGKDATQPVITPQLAFVAGDVQADTVMQTLPTQLQARLTDKASGVPLGGRVINWIVLEGGGTVFATVTQTGTDGIARQSWTLGPLAGNQRLVARWLDPQTGEPVTLDTARATAIPDVATQMTIVGPTSIQGHSFTIAIDFADQFGNRTWNCRDKSSPNAVTWFVYNYLNDTVTAGAVQVLSDSTRLQAFKVSGADNAQFTIGPSAACGLARAHPDSVLVSFDPLLP